MDRSGPLRLKKDGPAMEETGENKVWILFANGEGSRLNLSLHPGKGEQNRPADAYVVTGGGLSRSARRAAESVYNWLQHNGRNPDRFVAGFDVQHADNSMVGESAGLAFAIALASRMLHKQGLAIAATGEVSGGQYPGPVAKVGGINEKVTAAITLLPPGGSLFYPAVNEADLADALKEECRSNGIALYPISSVAEAMDLLFLNAQEEADCSSAARSWSKRITVVGGISALLIAVSLGSWWLTTRGDTVDKMPVQKDEVEVAAVAAEPQAVDDQDALIALPEQDIIVPPQPAVSEEHSRNNHGFD